jgi:hypothetical protein
VATAQDLIKGALRRINSYQSGEALAQPDAQDCLDTLNDLLDSWSIDKNLIYGSVENILPLIAGQAQYRIGNPLNTALGLPNFTGYLTAGSPIITGVIVPAQMVLLGTLSDVQSAVPSGATITAFSASANTVTMSAPSTVTQTAADVFSYTIPGDWAIPRPNRITHGFTRFSQLDFTCEVTMSQSRFTEILYKAQPGPWPTVAWYNPQMPYGLLNFYRTPGNSSLFHLFTDTILSSLTINQTFELPAGYARAIKWCLAKEICAEYGYEITEAIRTHAAESLAMVKALNALPAAKARYDSMLVGNRANAGWIFTGGYN